MGGGSKSRKRSSSEDEGGRSEKRRRKEKKSHKHRSHKEKKTSNEKHRSKHRKSDRHGSKSDIQELSKDDYFAMNNEFATWLKEEKNVYFSDLSSESARELFSDFIKRNGTIESLNLDTMKASQAGPGVPIIGKSSSNERINTSGSP